MQCSPQILAQQVGDNSWPVFFKTTYIVLVTLQEVAGGTKFLELLLEAVNFTGYRLIRRTLITRYSTFIKRYVTRYKIFHLLLHDMLLHFTRYSTFVPLVDQIFVSSLSILERSCSIVKMSIFVHLHIQKKRKYLGHLF